jgi:hypothetical protein
METLYTSNFKAYISDFTKRSKAYWAINIIYIDFFYSICRASVIFTNDVPDVNIAFYNFKARTNKDFIFV